MKLVQKAMYERGKDDGQYHIKNDGGEYRVKSGENLGLGGVQGVDQAKAGHDHNRVHQGIHP